MGRGGFGGGGGGVGGWGAWGWGGGSGWGGWGGGGGGLGGGSFWWGPQTPKKTTKPPPPPPQPTKTKKTTLTIRHACVHLMAPPPATLYGSFLSPVHMINFIAAAGAGHSGTTLRFPPRSESLHSRSAQTPCIPVSLSRHFFWMPRIFYYGPRVPAAAISCRCNQAPKSSLSLQRLLILVLG